MTAPGHPTGAVLTTIYERLLSHYGPGNWWPTHTGSAWEVMLGAVLTQRTTWKSVELALANILSCWGPEGLSQPEIVLQAPDETLSALVRPAGYYTVKPRKLKGLAKYVHDEGGISALLASTENTGVLRARLLETWGVGPETADAILLYALGRPVFVADNYALRLGVRWGLLERSASYDRVRALFMDNLPHDTRLFNEYHALIVTHGKTLCRPRPLCERCPLNHDIPMEGAQGPAPWRCPRLYVQRADR